MRPQAIFSKIPQITSTVASRIVVMLIIGLATLAVTSDQAAAESTKDAMIAIGLTGTWSPDCSKGIEDGPGWNVYSIPVLGDLKIQTVNQFGKIDYSIDSAVRATETKIMIRSHVTKVDLKVASIPPLSVGTEVEVVEEKIGDKFKLLSRRVGDEIIVKEGLFVRTGLPMPLLEKCLNK